MSELWVANASPVITLAKIDELSLLTAVAGQLIVPEAVALELAGGPEGDPARRAIEAGWGERAAAKEIPEIVVEWGLGSGETAVLSLALERCATAVLDDASARTAARSLGVQLIGTLGVVMRAKLQGTIACASSVIARLRDVGLFLDDRVVSKALLQLGETWPPQGS